MIILVLATNENLRTYMVQESALLKIIIYNKM